MDIKSLPPLPADIQTCIRNAQLAPIPDRDLTSDDMAKFMGDDTMRFNVLRACGERALKFYDDIRENWI